MSSERAPVRAEDLRVLQVVPILAMGGLERVATRLTLGLRPCVKRIAVAGRTGVTVLGSEQIEAPLREGGIRVYRIPRARGRARDVFRAAVALVPVLLRECPDVIHAHNPVGGAAAALARLLSFRRRVAIVTTYHGVEEHKLARATRILALTSDLVVGVGPASTRSLEESGLAPDRTATVHNAFSLDRGRERSAVRAEFGIPDDAEIVVTVGRYSPEKNQALLLEALATMIPARPSLYALVVGVGDLEQELRDHATALGIADRVLVTGPRSDAHDVIAAADVFALSSSSEGLPLVVLEAMALRVAVVSTDVGGVGDAVVDELTGLLVPPDDAAALAAALTRLLDDAGLRERIAEAALAWVSETCSEEAMVASYLRLYVDAVSRRRRRPATRRTGASRSK